MRACGAMQDLDRLNSCCVVDPETVRPQEFDFSPFRCKVVQEKSQKSKKRDKDGEEKAGED